MLKLSPQLALAGSLAFATGCAPVSGPDLACRPQEMLLPAPVTSSHYFSRDRATQLGELDVRLHRRLMQNQPADPDGAFFELATLFHAYTAAMAEFAASHGRDEGLREIAAAMVRSRLGELKLLCEFGADQLDLSRVKDRATAMVPIDHPRVVGPRFGVAEYIRVQKAFVEAALADLGAAVVMAETYLAVGSNHLLRTRANAMARMYRRDMAMLAAWTEAY